MKGPLYSAGEAFIETSGECLEISNARESIASVSSVSVLPAGADLTTMVWLRLDVIAVGSRLNH